MQGWLILAGPEMPAHGGEGVDERRLMLGVPRRAPSRRAPQASYTERISLSGPGGGTFRSTPVMSLTSRLNH